MNNSIKLLSTYIIGIGLYGYHRSLNNLYNSKKFNTRENLVVDQMMDGFKGLIWYSNPFTHPYVFYGIAKRCEKKYRNMPITKEDFEY